MPPRLSEMESGESRGKGVVDDGVYSALVSRGNRMGGPITLGDLNNGLLGPEGREYANKLRVALKRCRIPFDNTTTIG